jgi:hypothetical protein
MAHPPLRQAVTRLSERCFSRYRCQLRCQLRATANLERSARRGWPGRSGECSRPVAGSTGGSFAHSSTPRGAPSRGVACASAPLRTSAASCASRAPARAATLRASPSAATSHVPSGETSVLLRSLATGKQTRRATPRVAGVPSSDARALHPRAVLRARFGACRSQPATTPAVSQIRCRSTGAE